jgi:hypothetical protein
VIAEAALGRFNQVDIVRRPGLTVTLRDNLAVPRTPTFVELSHLDVASDI